MNERALTVFEQYELDITETFKIRGNYGCNTPDGKYILQEYDNSNDKMVSMKSLYNHLESRVSLRHAAVAAMPFFRFADHVTGRFEKYVFHRYPLSCG